MQPLDPRLEAARRAGRDFVERVKAVVPSGDVAHRVPCPGSGARRIERQPQSLIILAQRILGPLALGDVDAFAKKKFEFSVLVTQRGHAVESTEQLVVPQSILDFVSRRTGSRQGLLELAAPACAHFRQVSPPGTIEEMHADQFLSSYAGGAKARVARVDDASLGAQQSAISELMLEGGAEAPFARAQRRFGALALSNVRDAGDPADDPAGQRRRLACS